MTTGHITPTRIQAKGWARVGRAGAHLLRRGAWYPVVRISSSHIVVLDVNRRNVPVDRRFLEIRYHPPERWSIVRCEPREIQRVRSEEHTSELQSRLHLVCRLLLEKKKKDTAKP